MMMRSLSSSIKRKTKKKLFSSKKKGGSVRGDPRQGIADAVEGGADDPASVAGRSHDDSAAFFGLARSGDGSYESLERAKEEGKAFELQNMEEVRQAHVERDMLKAMGPVALAFQNEIQMEARPATPNTSANDLLLGSAEPPAATTTTTTTEQKGKEKAGEAEALQHIVYGDADYYVLLVLTHLPREVRASSRTSQHANTREFSHVLYFFFVLNNVAPGAVSHLLVPPADGPLERGPDVQAPQGGVRRRIPLACSLLRTTHATRHDTHNTETVS